MYEIKENDLIMVRKMINKEFRMALLIYPSYREDIFQEGCIGLVEASKRFDSSRGYEFSTLAYAAIRNRILKYITRYLNRKRVDTISLETTKYTDDDNASIGDLIESREDYTQLITTNTLKDIEDNLGYYYKAIMQLRMEGYKQREIAKILNISENTIYNYARDVKEYVVTGKVNKSKKYLTKHDREMLKNKVVELYSSGMKRKNIVKQLDASKGVVDAIVTEYRKSLRCS